MNFMAAVERKVFTVSAAGALSHQPCRCRLVIVVWHFVPAGTVVVKNRSA